MSTRLANPNQQKSHNIQLAITAYGLQSVAGNKDFALFGATASLISASSEDSNLEVPSPDGNGSDSVLTAPIPKFKGFECEDRIIQCLQSSIMDATDYLLQEKTEEKTHLLLVVTPASIYERSNLIKTEAWKELLIDELREFSDLHFHFVQADANVSKNLQSALAALNEGKINSVIFAGSDSLIDELTYEELKKQNRLSSNNFPDGVVPGEAAACVIIQKIDVTKSPVHAILKGITFAEEPNSGKPHLKKMTGLSEAIHNVTQMAKQQPDNIDCVIHTHSGEQHFDLEWYQASQILWPNKVPENERVAYQLGELDEPPKLAARKLPEELNTNFSVGEIGAASIPLGLVLAGARFDFNYPMVKNCLVCEASEFPFRGAILLENPKAIIQTKT